jgi:hypothetical protein
MRRRALSRARRTLLTRYMGNESDMSSRGRLSAFVENTRSAKGAAPAMTTAPAMPSPRARASAVVAIALNAARSSAARAP